MGRSSRAPSSRSSCATSRRPAATLAVTLALGCFAALASVASAGCDKGKAAATDGEAGAGSTDGVGAATTGESPPLLDGFEGEVDVSGKGDKPTDTPVSIALMIKGGKIRADIPEQLAKSGAGPLAGGGKGYGILDSAAKKVYVVLDSNKQVIEIDLDKAAEHLKNFTPPGQRPEPGAAAPPKAAPPKITKTGKFDTVAGHKCENWDVATDHRQGTVCIAEEGFSWLSIQASVLTGMPPDRQWMGELLDGKHFPMRFVGYGPDGTTETGRIEVTKIDKKTLPASQFEYPPEYTLIDLEQMMRGFGMGGMGGGMGGMGGVGGRPGMPSMPPIPPPPPPPK
jgi:hypothetical protein